MVLSSTVDNFMYKLLCGYSSEYESKLLEDKVNKLEKEGYEPLFLTGAKNEVCILMQKS